MYITSVHGNNVIKNENSDVLCAQQELHSLDSFSVEVALGFLDCLMNFWL